MFNNMFSNMFDNPLTNSVGSCFYNPPQQQQSPLGGADVFSIFSFISMLMQVLQEQQRQMNQQPPPPPPFQCFPPPAIPIPQPQKQQMPLEAAVNYFRYEGSNVYKHSPNGPTNLTRAYLESVARGDVPGCNTPYETEAAQVVLKSANWNAIETAEHRGTPDGLVSLNDFKAFNI